MTLKQMYGRKRRVISYTVAKVSYTNYKGERITEEKRFEGISTENKFELYNAIKTKVAKVYVHEVVKAYYWEE